MSFLSPKITLQMKGMIVMPITTDKFSKFIGFTMSRLKQFADETKESLKKLDTSIKDKTSDVSDHIYGDFRKALLTYAEEITLYATSKALDDLDYNCLRTAREECETIIKTSCDKLLASATDHMRAIESRWEKLFRAMGKAI